jgi:hypothetical protein
MNDRIVVSVMNQRLRGRRPHERRASTLRLTTRAGHIVSGLDVAQLPALLGALS